MSTGKRGKRTPAKGKQKVTFRWWNDWAMVWILGGFGLTYLVFVPLKAHLLHWLFSLIGGVVGYVMGLLFDSGLPSRVVRFTRYRLMRTTVETDRGKQAKKRGR